MGLAHESSERPRHRAPRHVERVVKGDQWSARAPPRERARVSHSHQAHRQETAHVRRPRPDYTLDWDEPSKHGSEWSCWAVWLREPHLLASDAGEKVGPPEENPALSNVLDSYNLCVKDHPNV